jgi:hypothetical protein
MTLINSRGDSHTIWMLQNEKEFLHKKFENRRSDISLILEEGESQYNSTRSTDYKNSPRIAGAMSTIFEFEVPIYGCRFVNRASCMGYTDNSAFWKKVFRNMTAVQ